MQLKARIRQIGNLYYGEVYAEWLIPLSRIFGYSNDTWEGWNIVTSGCLTYWGAKYALFKWKRDNGLDEFEL